MSLVEEQWKFIQDVAKLLEFVRSKGWVVTGGELWRPPVTQEYYVRIGRSKTMRSMHIYRLAIDLNFFKPLTEEEYQTKKARRETGLVEVDGGYYQLTWNLKDIEPFGTYWESLDPRNRWGGHFKSFKDVPHFERYIKA